MGTKEKVVATALLTLLPWVNLGVIIPLAYIFGDVVFGLALPAVFVSAHFTAKIMRTVWSQQENAGSAAQASLLPYYPLALLPVPVLLACRMLVMWLLL